MLHECFLFPICSTPSNSALCPVQDHLAEPHSIKEKSSKASWGCLDCGIPLTLLFLPLPKGVHAGGSGALELHGVLIWRCSHPATAAMPWGGGSELVFAGQRVMGDGHQREAGAGCHRQGEGDNVLQGL